MCRWIVQFLAIRKTAAASWTFSSGAYILQPPKPLKMMKPLKLDPALLEQPLYH